MKNRIDQLSRNQIEEIKIACLLKNTLSIIKYSDISPYLTKKQNKKFHGYYCDIADFGKSKIDESEIEKTENIKNKIIMKIKEK